MKGFRDSYSHPLSAGYVGNLTTLAELQERCRFTRNQTAEYLGVSVQTYRRWLNDRSPNVTAVRLLAIRAGYLPWPGWQDWEMHAGKLYPPGYRQGIGPGEILAVPYRMQLIAELQRQIREFNAMADQTETDRRPPLALLTES